MNSPLLLAAEMRALSNGRLSPLVPGNDLAVYNPLFSPGLNPAYFAEPGLSCGLFSKLSSIL